MAVAQEWTETRRGLTKGLDLLRGQLGYVDDRVGAEGLDQSLGGSVLVTRK